MTFQPLSQSSRLIRLSQIIGPQGLIGVSKSTIWVWVAEGRFPAPVRLGKRAIAWRYDQVMQFIESREVNR